jgi:protoporphyrin/coproporphyrin ferrochelatase
MSDNTAILLLAHGTPDSIEEIPEYLSRVTSGRPMPQSVIDEVSHRFSLIGSSPLTRLTMEQGRLLSEALNMPVYVGMRNWKPYIADVVATMRANGITKIVAICLAPQNSRTSVGLYRRAVFAATEGLQVEFIEGWADHPQLIAAFAERLRTTLPLQPEASVIFTAHSVPERTVQASDEAGPDPYADEAQRTARLVAEQVGLAPDQWTFAFQSQGMSGGPWIGPTVEDTLTHLHQRGIHKVIVQPIGFLCDHVEILYDIDIGFRDYARNLGMELTRPESLNSSSLLTAALADLARKGLERLP